VKPPAASVGPGIFVKDGATVMLQGLTVQGATGTNGDGIHCVSPTTKSTLVLVESTIKSNESHGVESSYCDVTLRRNVIQGNDGGGADLSKGKLEVVNNVVFNNGDNTSSIVGGLSLSPSSPTGNVVYNNTVINNEALTSKAGINCGISIPVYNSIVYFNGSQPVADCTFFNSDVEGGAAGSTNIDADPKIVSPGTGNFSIDPSTSPCVDQGASTTGVTEIDIKGNDRSQGVAPDIGAYEVK